MEQETATGIISRERLEASPQYAPWFKSNYNPYQPDGESVVYIDNHKANLEFLVYLGTWCKHSRRTVPRLLKALDAAHVPATKVKLYGLDEKLKGADMPAEQKITQVPTLVIYCHGRHCGSVTDADGEHMENEIKKLVELQNEK